MNYLPVGKELAEDLRSSYTQKYQFFKILRSVFFYVLKYVENDGETHLSQKL